MDSDRSKKRDLFSNQTSFDHIVYNPLGRSWKIKYRNRRKEQAKDGLIKKKTPIRVHTGHDSGWKKNDVIKLYYSPYPRIDQTVGNVENIGLMCIEVRWFFFFPPFVYAEGKL